MKLIITNAESFGLKCVDEKNGIFHLQIQSESDDETTLNIMSELENTGFHYKGIENMVGKGAVMIFGRK